MGDSETQRLKIACPCCEAILTVDVELGTVIGHEMPARPQRVQQLRDAGRMLEQEASQRREKYRNILDAEKDRGKTLDRKFQELLKKTKDRPVERPLKDIDLD